MPEIWKAIPGFEGMYEVSDQGRVRSVDRVVTRSDGKQCQWKGRVLKQKVNTEGRPCVNLCSGYGCQRTAKVHRLVAEAFIGTRPDGQDVRHKDGNPLNNTADNLTYGTRTENLLDVPTYGGKYGVQKIEFTQVPEIRDRITRGEPIRQIARLYGVDPSTIRNIRDRKTFNYI